MNCTATECECCEESTYHIPLELDMLTYDFSDGFCLHLNEDELHQLYFALKEHKCQ